MSNTSTRVHTPWPGLIEAYRDRLPMAAGWTPVTLLEGGTPLVRAPRLSERTGCTVYLKIEGANPTGSFKDRGMTMAVTEAVALGRQAVLCASTGNTSASAAAYAARAGITCAVLIPQGKIAMGKLAQAVMHGAKIIQVDGNFDDCLELVRKLTADYPSISLVNSVNPVRLEGQKTAAFEIVDALGTAPDVHALPVERHPSLLTFSPAARACCIVFTLASARCLPAKPSSPPAGRSATSLDASASDGAIAAMIPLRIHASRLQQNQHSVLCPLVPWLLKIMPLPLICHTFGQPGLI